MKGLIKTILLVIMVCIVPMMQSCLNNGSKAEGEHATAKLSSEQIGKKFSSGVVYIYVSGHYELEFSDLVTVYFTPNDEGNGYDFEFDEEEVTNASWSGTGFFIGEDGLIATNAHVVGDDVEYEKVKTHLNVKVAELSASAQNKINDLTQDMARLNSLWTHLPNNSAEERMVEQSLQEKKAELSELQKIQSLATIIMSAQGTVSFKGEIGVAYNNTYVTNTSDFHACVVKAKDKRHDIAIIQLNDKKTPTDRAVFPLNAKGKNPKNVKLGTEVYVIGFNYGLALAKTSEGIVAQVDNGKVTQDRGDEILYNISVLGGSSGGPVLDSYGNLVAVNYARLGTNTQGFGSKVKWLQELYKNLKGQ